MTNRKLNGGATPISRATSPLHPHLLLLLGVATLGGATSASAAVVDVPGNASLTTFTEATHSMNFIVGAGNSGRLLGDWQNHWNGGTGSFSVPVDTNGFVLKLNTGGGNSGHVASGAISGTGSVTIDSAPRSGSLWSVPYTIGGTSANSYAGSTVISRGNVNLNKSAGVDALPGAITLGSTGETARLTWLASNQINDSASINVVLPTATGGFTAEAALTFLNIGGFSDTIGALTLGDSGARTQIRTSAGGVLTVNTLSVGGYGMAAGTYTKTSGWIIGDGSVVVLNGTGAPVVDISNATTPGDAAHPGDGVKVDVAVGAGNTARLVGFTSTYWSGFGFSVPVDLNGNTLVVDNGGGNTCVASGAVSGNGILRIDGGGSAAIRITGGASNTYTGTTEMVEGVVNLEKTFGNALNGAVTITRGGVVWVNHNQIQDTSSVNVTVPVSSSQAYNYLDLAGFTETIGSLTLGDAGAKTQIRTGTAGVLTVSSLTVGGVPMTAGTYTNTSGWITGGGSVVVLSGNEQPMVDISNEVTPFESAHPELGVKIDTAVGAGNTGRLVGFTQTYWSSFGFTVPLNLNGNTLSVDSGGGNTCIASGVISGNGIVRLVGGGSLPLRVTGGFGNTYTGTTEVTRGVINLEKTSGNALNGAITITAGGLVWVNGNQVNDTSTIALAGTATYLNFAGKSETAGALRVTADASIYLGSGTSVVHFADSSAQAWTTGKQLIIREWDGSTAGGGSEGVFFGNSASGLSSPQLGNVGFVNPAGFPEGMYHAQILPTGEVVPTGTAVVPQNLPYDISPAAVAARAAIYTSTGRADLTSVSTLEAGSRIVFFGDSITWLNGYISRINAAISSGSGTAGQGITLINRGINGGGAIEIRDGLGDSGYPGSSPQASFSSLLASDQADIAVIFIGVNDVWWRGTTAAAYEQALRDMAASAAAQGVKLIFATPSAYNESPIGGDPLDPKMNQYSDIVREVASDTGATLVDLRKVFVSYWQNNNYEIRLDGSFVTLRNNGLLTYDGVHPTNLGNDMIADHISAGILASVSAGPSFSDWADYMGLTGEAAGFNADPDHDGIANGIEFVIGGEPNPAFAGSDSSGLMPTVTATGGNLVFTFTCMEEAAFLKPFVEFSTTLNGGWMSAAAMGATVVTTPGIGFETVVVTLPKGSNPRIFARLSVIQP